MGMLAGITDDPGYRKDAGYLAVDIPFHEISFIVSESTQAAFGATALMNIPGDFEPQFRKYSTANPLGWIPQFWSLDTGIPVK